MAKADVGIRGVWSVCLSATLNSLPPLLVRRTLLILKPKTNVLLLTIAPGVKVFNQSIFNNNNQSICNQGLHLQFVEFPSTELYM